MPSDLEYEVGNARIWGGIHFRSAVDDGVAIGKRTVNQVLAHHFQKIDTLEQTSAPEGEKARTRRAFSMSQPLQWAPVGANCIALASAATCRRLAARMQPLSRTLARTDHRGE